MRKSGVILVISSFLCLAAAVLCIYAALGFSDSLERDRLRVLVVVKEDGRGLDFSATPLKMPALSAARREELLKKLIVEYIVARYTWTGSATESRRIFGGWGKDMASGSLFKLASLATFDPERPDAPPYLAPYYDFMKEKEEIRRLSESGTTRTVEITVPPRRYKDDMWIAEVEFVYKGPAVWNLAQANREKYELQMTIEPITDLRTPTAAMLLNLPSAVFEWRIVWFKRVVK
ncbi:MAG: hypothetical protein LBL52_01870 [Rickettsiales bacterium]|jgi:hypothetical protein|nr:hypothetical protein [Rickettsiales bacterium]